MVYWRVLKTHLVLGRVSNILTVVTNVLVGAYFFDNNIPIIKTMPLILAGIFLYIGGMYLNDAFDVGFDTIWKKNRPIVNGLISQKMVYFFSYLYLSIGYFIYISKFWNIDLHLVQIFVPTLLLLSIYFYNRLHKKITFAPILMGLCRGFLILTVYFNLTNKISSLILFISIIEFIYIVGLTMMARWENERKPILSKLNIILLAPAFIWGICSYNFVTTIISIFGILYTVHSVKIFYKVNMGKGIASLISIICLIDAIFLSSINFELGLFSITCFFATRLFQKYIPAS